MKGVTVNCLRFQSVLTSKHDVALYLLMAFLATQVGESQWSMIVGCMKGAGVEHEWRLAGMV